MSECDPNLPYSTYNNPKVTNYSELAKRIALDLGYPVVNLEIHNDQVNEAIARSVEFFTKFAGQDEIFLIFNSKIYQSKRGIYLPDCFEKSYGTNTVDVTTDNVSLVQRAQTKKNTLTLIDTFSFTDQTSTPIEYTLRFTDPFNGRAETNKLVVAATVSGAVEFTDYGDANTFPTGQIAYNFVSGGDNQIQLKATAFTTGIVDIVKTSLSADNFSSQIYNESQVFTSFTSAVPVLIDYYTKDRNLHPVEYLFKYLDDSGNVQVSNYLIAYNSTTPSVNSIELAVTYTTTRFFNLSAISNNNGIMLYIVPTANVANNTGVLNVAKNLVYPKNNTDTNRFKVVTLSGSEVTLDTFDTGGVNTAPYEYTIEFVADGTGDRDVRKWLVSSVAFNNAASVSGIEIGAVRTNSINFGQLYFTTSDITATLVLSGQIPGTAYIYKNVQQSQNTIAQDLGIDDTTGEKRKITAVHSFEEGTSESINSLFTIEQTLAQQTYFSYAMGNYGFDLISWHLVKGYLETRAKIFATKQYFQFNPDTQYLQLIPEPSNTHYWGLISCYVEKPLKNLIKEPWVFQYALALTKISLGRIRGKYTSVQLFGGGTINYNDMLNEGLKEKESLEQMLLKGASSGFGDTDPPMFYLG